MGAYASLERQRRMVWPAWSGALVLLLMLGASPLSPCLASAALMAGRVLGAADRSSAERCRRAVAVLGLFATVLTAPLLALSSGWSVPAEVLALAGWVCFSLGEKDPPTPSAPRPLAFELLASGALLAAADLVSALSSVPPQVPACALCCSAAVMTLRLAGSGQGLSESELFSACAPALLRAAALGAGGGPLLPAAYVIVAAAGAATLVVDAIRERGTRDTAYSALLRRALDDLAERELSARESEVLVRTLCGESRRTIADALGVSESTVGTNRTRGYEKLRVGSKSELIEAVGAWTGSEAARHDDGVARGWPTWLRVAVACALVVVILVPWAGAARSDVAFFLGGALSGVALVALLALPPDTGGARALQRATGSRPSWERGVAVVLCAVVAPVLAVGSWPTAPGRRLLVALLVLLTIAYLGTSPVRSDPDADAATWVRRFFRAGLRELACRGREALGLAGVMFLSASTIAPQLAAFPGAFEGAWVLAPVLALLVFGAAFGPSEQSEKDESLAYLRRAGLSELQANIALALARGDGERVICERLHVAPGTVKSARVRCYRALGVHSASELREALEGRPRLTGSADPHPRG